MYILLKILSKRDLLSYHAIKQVDPYESAQNLHTQVSERKPVSECKFILLNFSIIFLIVVTSKKFFGVRQIGEFSQSLARAPFSV